MKKRVARTIIAGLLAAGAIAAAAPAAAQGQCGREALEEIAGQYVEGQRQGSIFTLPVGEWVDYRENGRLESTTTGVISQPSEFAWHVDVVDTANCRVIVQGVILEPKPVAVSTRLAWSFNGLGQIRSTVVREGDPGFDAQAAVRHASGQDWSDLPADSRNSREELAAAAAAYLDRIGGAEATAPVSASCERNDNGVHSADCAPAAGPAFVEREFTVDEVKGAVAVVSSRGSADGPVDARVFRIEDGQIRYVNALSPAR